MCILYTREINPNLFSLYLIIIKDYLLISIIIIDKMEVV